MSKPIRGFDLSKTPDTTQSVFVNQLPLGLTNVFYDSQNNYITANVSETSSSNLTYTTNGKPVEYKAKQLWILGQDPDNSLHVIDGTSYAGELIIKHMSTTGNDTLFLCYPLMYKKTASNSQIDFILNNYSKTELAGIMSLDIAKDISLASSTAGAKTVYVQYLSSKISSSNVLVYTNALIVSSTNIAGLKNTNPPIDMFPNPMSSYNIIPLTVAGDWMECDYVPIDSEEVATLNLPLGSNVIKNGDSVNAMQKVIMFIIFFFIFYFSYLILPEAYSTLAKRIIGKKILDRDTINEKIHNMDRILSGVFITISFLLVYYGVVSSSSNSGDYVTAGIIIAISFLIGFIMIRFKKMNSNPRQPYPM